MSTQIHQAAFRPRARLLRMMGDHLIGAPVMALFELVKNSYDADASACSVTVVEPQDPDRASIAVSDDGCGMTLSTITDGYLQLGSEYRVRQKASDNPFTPVHGRMPMGEKGIGRLAALRLGDRITVITTAQGHDTYRIVMDWGGGIDDDVYLDEVEIPVEVMEPSEHVGTTVVIEGLRSEWTRERVAELQMNLAMMYLPKDRADTFRVHLDVRSSERSVRNWQWDSEWIDTERLLAKAQLGSIHCTVRANGPGSNRMDYYYQNRDPSGRDCYRTGWLMPLDGAPALSDLGLSKFDFSVSAYDPALGDLTPKEREFLAGYLDTWAGMRIYRDGMRVHHHERRWYDAHATAETEAAEDERLHVGQVMLQSEDGWNALREQASRESLSEGPALAALTQAVQSCFHRFRAHQMQGRDAGGGDFTASARELRDILSTHTEHPELAELAELIVRKFDDQIDQFVVSSAASQYVAASFDELVSATARIRELAQETDTDWCELRRTTGRADDLVNTLAYSLRRSGWSDESLGRIVARCADITHERRRRAGITLVNGFANGADLTVNVRRRLIVGALLHLMDNSIYWLEQLGGTERTLYMGPCSRYSGERGIVVVDNGPGFRDDPSVLLRPNVSLRKDALGLGLYTVERVMNHHNGKLEFYPEGANVRRPDNHLMGIPSEVDTSGAGIILLFPWDDGSAW